MTIIITETFFSTPPSWWWSPGRCRLFWPCCISLHAGEKSGPYHAGVQGAYDRLSGGHCDSELWYRAREYCIRVPSEGWDLPFYHNLQGRIVFNTVNPSLFGTSVSAQIVPKWAMSMYITLVEGFGVKWGFSVLQLGRFTISSSHFISQ